MSKTRYEMLAYGVFGIPYKVEIEMYNVERDQKWEE